MRFSGKSVLLMGGGQALGEGLGNGRAAALLFAREGARICVVDRDIASAQETEALIRAEGGEAFALRADVANASDVAAAVNAAVLRHGRIDILHNNVGMNTGDGPTADLPEIVWRRILDINLTGAFLCAREVVPLMRKQGGGVILNVSSIAAVCAVNLPAYRASKAGLNAFSQLLAFENAPHGVRVNVLMPGMVDTPAAVEAPARSAGASVLDVRTARNARVPLAGGMGDAWDIAHAALFLSSDEAKFITGVVLPIDGGQSLRVG